MKELGNKIAQKRKDAGLTQTEFAEKLFVTRQTVSRWESGAVLPDIEKISAIASILGTTCDYLLKDDHPDTPAAPSPTIGRLLRAAQGKKVRLNFFEEDADLDLFNKVCVITDFEGNWMKVEADTKKGRIEKLIPVSSVLSLEYVKEDE